MYISRFSRLRHCVHICTCSTNSCVLSVSLSGHSARFRSFRPDLAAFHVALSACPGLRRAGLQSAGSIRARLQSSFARGFCICIRALCLGPSFLGSPRSLLKGKTVRNKRSFDHGPYHFRRKAHKQSVEVDGVMRCEAVGFSVGTECARSRQ